MTSLRQNSDFDLSCGRAVKVRNEEIEIEESNHEVARNVLAVDEGDVLRCFTRNLGDICLQMTSLCQNSLVELVWSSTPVEQENARPLGVVAVLGSLRLMKVSNNSAVASTAELQSQFQSRLVKVSNNSGVAVPQRNYRIDSKAGSRQRIPVRLSEAQFFPFLYCKVVGCESTEERLY